METGSGHKTLAMQRAATARDSADEVRERLRACGRDTVGRRVHRPRAEPGDQLTPMIPYMRDSPAKAGRTTQPRLNWANASCCGGKAITDGLPRFPQKLGSTM